MAESTFYVGDIVELLFEYRIKNGNVYDHRSLQRGIIIYVDQVWEAYDVMWTDGSLSRNLFLDEDTTICIVPAKGTSRSSTAHRTSRTAHMGRELVLRLSGSALT